MTPTIKEWKEIFNSIGEGIAIIDTTHTIIEANQALSRVLEIPLNQIIGEKCYKVICNLSSPPKDCIIFKKKLEKKNKEVFKKNIGKYLLITQTAIKDNGKIRNIIYMIRDITQEKKLQENILKEKEFWENTFNSMKDGVAVIDKKCTIVKANKALAELVGRKPDEIIGKKCYNIIHGRNSPIKECLLKKAIKTKKSEDLEIYEPFLKKYISIRESPIFENGELKFVIHVIRDITKKKEAENKLREYAKELEELNKSKEIFADILRHDLLNPVMVVEGLARLALQEDDIEEMKQYLGVILRNMYGIKSIIEDASLLGKVESLRDLELKEIDVSEIIFNTIQDFQIKAKEKNIRIIFEPKECIIKANPVIEQVFSNLISNAIKYSPKNSEVIVKIEEGKDTVKISVEDQGSGVPDEYKKSIFERFKRVKKKGVKGTGLGLAIVKRLVELHGGRVWVEDNPKGKGSIFFVELPKTKS